MTLPIHVCKSYDAITTLCEIHPAGIVAAVKYAEFGRAHGPFCAECETKAKALYAASYTEDSPMPLDEKEQPS